MSRKFCFIIKFLIYIFTCKFCKKCGHSNANYKCIWIFNNKAFEIYVKSTLQLWFSFCFVYYQGILINQKIGHVKKKTYERFILFTEDDGANEKNQKNHTVQKEYSSINIIFLI